MHARGLLLVVTALGLAAATPAGAQRGPASEPERPVPSKTAPPETKSKQLPPPIVFFVARGDPNSCGVGCREWIAAEGTIDTGADDRLRALLKRLGGRKLPIFFHSPGGSVQTGLAIGRLMRERGLTAGVGWTVPAGCDPKEQREAACDKLKRSGRDLVAVLDTGHAMCNSSCVYALVGAATREVGAGIQLGVHSSAISFTLQRIDAGGHVTRVPTHVEAAVERKALQGGYERISAYLREMGIGQGLLAAAREIRNDTLRFLTRDEIVAFGIDRRDVVEGMWWFVDEAAGASAIKVIEESRAGTFRKSILRLTCAQSASKLRLQYGRELGDKGAWPARLRVTAGSGSFLLDSPVTVTTNRRPMEVRRAYLPMSVLDDTAFTIEPAEPGEPARRPVRSGAADPVAPSAAPTQATAQDFLKLTAQSVGPGLGALARRCGNGPLAPAPGSTFERI